LDICDIAALTALLTLSKRSPAARNPARPESTRTRPVSVESRHEELMDFMGHADLHMVNRYVKLLPQPGEDDAAARLNDYLRRSAPDPRDA
jgi:hypothetical protein